MPIECFASHRHFSLVERVLHDEVRIELIDLPHDCVHVTSQGIREQQEFRPRQGLEASQTELVRLEVVQASHWYAWVWIGV